MTRQTVPRFNGVEQQALGYRARIVDWDGDLLLPADVSAITYKVFELEDRGQVVTQGTLTPATVILDPAQTDDVWPWEDAYNFRWAVPAAAFPHGGRVYRVEIYFTLAAGDAFADFFEVFAADLLGV